jgi:uncharacterized cupin superfamily protein
MSYRTVRVDDLENAPSPAREKKELDEALGIEAFGLNVYTVAPGERVPWGFHRHPRHEEAFYVLEGVLTVDTTDESLTVEAGEVLSVPPNHPTRAPTRARRRSASSPWGRRRRLTRLSSKNAVRTVET